MKENIHVCIDLATNEDTLLHSLFHSVTERKENMSTILHLLDQSQPVRHALRAARMYRSIEPLKNLQQDLPIANKMAIVVSKMWATGRVLRVRFLDGSDSVQAKVMHFAKVWERYANLRFNFVPSGPAEIRIAFKQGAGSWSYMGTDCLLIINQEEPTMNFGWFDESTSDMEFSRTTLHEFGHAIGCIHEHQHPENPIPWDKEKVYAFYAKHGWDRPTVDQQVFARYDQSITNFSAYDKTSIMHYPIPVELLTNAQYATELNTKLSPEDMAFALKSYPFI